MAINVKDERLPERWRLIPSLGLGRWGVVPIVAGLFLLLPIGSFGIGRWINLAGLALAIGIVLREKLLRRGIKGSVQKQ